MNAGKKPFSFSAIVGQEKLKTAYLANIVNPNIGGLLISGPKGSGKSTVVHSVEYLLPEYDAVADCEFNCNPDRPDRFCTLCKEKHEVNSITKKMKIINLPLSCTEDRLIGSIDIETLLKTGEKKVRAGILGEANRNILYIDEVNLLPDHLVDDILEAASSPWNTIEREGISIMHPDDFVLVGTMNPEEGELRPQILDRFSLCVKIDSVTEPRQRVEIVKRNLLYDNNPEKFARLFEKGEKTLSGIIVEAKELIGKVEMDEIHLYAIAEACSELKVDGQRPDIVIVKTAQTIAAIDRRNDVIDEDILLAAEFALSHRTRDGGLLEPPSAEDIISVFSKALKAGESEMNSAQGRKKFSSSSVDVSRDADEFMEDLPDESEFVDDDADGTGEKKKQKR